MNLDSMRLGIRYSDAGIATRSYILTLYIITRRQSMHLWSSGRQCRFGNQNIRCGFSKELTPQKFVTTYYILRSKIVFI